MFMMNRANGTVLGHTHSILTYMRWLRRGTTSLIIMVQSILGYLNPFVPEGVQRSEKFG